MCSENFWSGLENVTKQKFLNEIETNDANATLYPDVHSSIAGFVNNNCFSGLIDVMVQPEVRRHPVQQHPVIWCHRGKLSLLTPEKNKITSNYVKLLNFSRGINAYVITTLQDNLYSSWFLGLTYSMLLMKSRISCSSFSNIILSLLEESSSLAFITAHRAHETPAFMCQNIQTNARISPSVRISNRKKDAGREEAFIMMTGRVFKGDVY